MVKKGLNMEEIKNRNIRSILSYLRTYGPNSRKIIAEKLNLTTASLTNLTNELIKSNLIIELGEVNEGKVGRKQVLIDLNSNSKISLGLEVRNKKINFIAIDIKANVLESKEWEFENKINNQDFEKVLKYLENYIKDKREKILGIGILVPGFIENEISKNSDIKDIKKKVEAILKIPTFIENNIRGLVEAELYLEKKYNNFWLVSYGPGVGSAIVLNGKVLLGNKKKSGEIGHIPLTLSKKKRSCKICNQNGCLESEIHFDIIKKRLALDSIEKKQEESDIDFFKRVLKKDDYKELKENLDILARYVSIGFSILDPEKLILSGEIFSILELYEFFISKIKFYNNLIKKDDIEHMEHYDYKRKIAAAILVLSDFFSIKDQ